ncbi:MAG: Fic family protein [Nitrospirae bacterium]|nr:Fic family protein [Nitrospirota bacterium]MDE3040083.1 Fic family protein [Nitrospirota bacterium]
MSYQPQFTVSARVVGELETIAVLRERILAATVQVPWMPSLQREARVRNTHSSTAIEGNPLTLEQVRLIEEGHELPAEPPRAKREVLNYLAGLRYIERHAEKKRIIHRDIFTLHKILAAGVMDQGDAGRYRDIQVYVGRYTPPAPQLVSGFMAELLGWWNEHAREWSPVISSAILHYQFEDIHPFADGNGRTGRALALWELYRRGFDTHHIFSVDEVYGEDRPAYYAALANVRKQGNDLTEWTEYSARALRVTLDRVWTRIQHLGASAAPKKVMLRPRQEQLLRLLKDRRSMTPKEIRESLRISKQGAMDLLNPLLEAGLVQRSGTQKSGRYRLT